VARFNSPGLRSTSVPPGLRSRPPGGVFGTRGRDRRAFGTPGRTAAGADSFLAGPPRLEPAQRLDDQFGALRDAEARRVQEQVVVLRARRVLVEVAPDEGVALAVELLRLAGRLLGRHAEVLAQRGDAVREVAHQPHAQRRLGGQQVRRPAADDYAVAL